MYIDTKVLPTRHALYLKCVFLLGVLLVGVLAQATWQFIVVVGLFLVLMYVERMRHVPLCELSVKEVDGVWYLGMYDDDEREIWQAHLRHAQFIDIGAGAVRLTFEVVVPTERTYVAVLFWGSIDPPSFARLRALSRFL